MENTKRKATLHRFPHAWTKHNVTLVEKDGEIFHVPFEGC